MKTFGLKTILFSATLIGTMMIGGTAFAEELNQGTTGEANLVTPTTTDPTDPSYPQLMLKSAPNLTFDDVTLDSAAISNGVSNVGVKSADKPVEVSDTRVLDAGATDKGWKVNVSASEFTLDGQTGYNLRGGVLSLATQTVAYDAATSTNQVTAGSFIDLNSSSQRYISTADSDFDGRGTTTKTIATGTTDAKLAVGPNNTKGKYTATLTWTLAATPVA